MGYNLGQKCWTTQVSASAHLAPSVYGLQSGPKVLDYTSVNISIPYPQCLWATIWAKSVGLHKCQHQHTCPQCLWVTIGAKNVELHKCQHQHTLPPVFMGYNWGQKCWTTLHKCQHQHTLSSMFMGYNWGQKCWTKQMSTSAHLAPSVYGLQLGPKVLDYTTQVSTSVHLAPSVYGLQLGPKVLDYTSVSISTPCPQCLWATIGAKSVGLHKCQHQHTLSPVFMGYNWGQKCWTTLHKCQHQHTLPPMFMGYNWGQKCWTAQVSTSAHLAPSVYGIQLGPKVLDCAKVYLSVIFPALHFLLLSATLRQGWEGENSILRQTVCDNTVDDIFISQSRKKLISVV